MRVSDRILEQLTYETRMHIKAEMDRLKRALPSTFEGVCLYCLEDIPDARYASGGAPKYCCDSHRKKYNRRHARQST